nr:unnamed protein product [Callosobruchus analis]
MNKPQILPITEDLLKRNAFITDSIAMYKAKQQQCSDLDSLPMLVSGEAAKMPISTYNFLSPFEVKLAERLAVEREEKQVPFLLTEDVRSAIDLLISKSVDCGIPSNNPFIYACSKKFYTTLERPLLPF